MNKEKVKEKGPDCFKCRHFYVTWDESFPRGCHAYGFKSKNIPSVEVYHSSGIKCLRFEAKEEEE